MKIDMHMPYHLIINLLGRMIRHGDLHQINRIFSFARSHGKDKRIVLGILEYALKCSFRERQLPAIRLVLSKVKKIRNYNSLAHTKWIFLLIARTRDLTSMKLLIILKSKDPCLSVYCQHALSVDLLHDDDFKRVLKAPKQLIKEFKAFCKSRKSVIMECMRDKGLPDVLGNKVFSMYNFKSDRLMDFLNEK